MNLKYTEPPFFGLSTAKRRQLQKFLSTELKDGELIEIGDKVIAKTKGIKGGVIIYVSSNKVGIAKSSTELKYFNRLYSKKHFTSISENSIIEYTVHRSMSNNETSDYNI